MHGVRDFLSRGVWLSAAKSGGIPGKLGTALEGPKTWEVT